MNNQSRIATIREGDTFGDTTPAIKYNLDNHLGSSNVLVDENGTLVTVEEYYPFGEMRSIRERHKKTIKHVSQTSFGAYSKKRYRFCGKEKDEESGLYYYGARYYAPWLCRFVSVDPKAGKYVFQSPFAYADNNPICKMDYNGEGTGESESNKPKSPLSAPVIVNNVSYQTYTIQQGDTLSEISEKIGVDMDFIADINDIKDKNKIKAGDNLLIVNSVKGVTKPAAQSAAKTEPKNGKVNEMINAVNLPRPNTSISGNASTNTSSAQGSGASLIGKLYGDAYKPSIKSPFDAVGGGAEAGVSGFGLQGGGYYSRIETESGTGNYLTVKGGPSSSYGASWSAGPAVDFYWKANAGKSIPVSELVVGTSNFVTVGLGISVTYSWATNKDNKPTLRGLSFGIGVGYSGGTQFTKKLK